MDQNLKTILDFIQHNENLSAEEKALLVGLVSNVDKELSITTFKLDRTEKVKRTSFEDGVKYMEFTEAVSRSAASGHVIDLPLQSV